MRGLLRSAWLWLLARLGFRRIRAKETAMPHQDEKVAEDEFYNSTFVGTGRTLDEAFAHAWEKGKATSKRLKVLDIEVAGENPITEYRVVLKA